MWQMYSVYFSKICDYIRCVDQSEIGHDGRSCIPIKIRQSQGKEAKYQPCKANNFWYVANSKHVCCALKQFEKRTSLMTQSESQVHKLKS